MSIAWKLKQGNCSLTSLPNIAISTLKYWNIACKESIIVEYCKRNGQFREYASKSTRNTSPKHSPRNSSQKHLEISVLDKILSDEPIKSPFRETSYQKRLPEKSNIQEAAKQLMNTLDKLPHAKFKVEKDETLLTSPLKEIPGVTDAMIELAQKQGITNVLEFKAALRRIDWFKSGRMPSMHLSVVDRGDESKVKVEVKEKKL